MPSPSKFFNEQMYLEQLHRSRDTNVLHRNDLLYSQGRLWFEILDARNYYHDFHQWEHEKEELNGPVIEDYITARYKDIQFSPESDMIEKTNYVAQFDFIERVQFNFPDDRKVLTCASFIDATGYATRVVLDNADVKTASEVFRHVPKCSGLDVTALSMIRRIIIEEIEEPYPEVLFALDDSIGQYFDGFKSGEAQIESLMSDGEDDIDSLFNPGTCGRQDYLIDICSKPEMNDNQKCKWLMSYIDRKCKIKIDGNLEILL